MKLHRPLIWNVISQTMLLLVAQWELGCSGMTLNLVPLPRAPRRSHGTRAGALAQRHKRSWVWNQFFVLEEFTGDEPLYVGKVRGSVKIETLTAKYMLMWSLWRCSVVWSFQCQLGQNKEWV